MFGSMGCAIINTFIKVAHFHIEGIMRWLSIVSNKPIENILFSKSGKRSKSPLQKIGLTQACNSPILQRFENGT